MSCFGGVCWASVRIAMGARTATVAFALGVAACLAFSCSSLVLTSDDVLPLAGQVAERHDGYVAADHLASPDDRTLWLSQTNELLTTLRASKTMSAAWAQRLLDPICARHDAYVDADATASDLHRRAWKRSSVLVRSLVDEAVARGVPR